MLRGVVLVILASGCLDASASQCADGRTCRPGTTCIDSLGLCADPTQLAACANLAEGDRCSSRTVVLGVCTDGVCLGSGCGNNVVETGEACDDGNTVGGDGCSASCASDESCGNKITDLDVGEECDCGLADDLKPGCSGPNSELAGVCDTSCRLRCGNGIVSPDEACDPGVTATVSCAGVLDNAGGIFDRGITTCSSSCQPVTSVGTCRYIGFRTRVVQPDPPIRDISVIADGDGFFVAGTRVNLGTDFVAGPDPFDAGAQLTAVWAGDVSTAVAVGASGTIVHFDGTAWTHHDFGTTDLVDVWGRAADDVYAIGDHVVIHWNGSAWSSLAPPAGSFRAVTGDANRIYVAGDGGVVLVHDGTTWSAPPTGTTANLTSISAHGGVVVAVGDAGTIVEDRGLGFVAGRTTTSADLTAVLGMDIGFFAAGDGGTLLFHDGRVWRPLLQGRGAAGSSTQRLLGLAGLPDGTGFGTIGVENVMTYEGAAWAPAVIPTTQSINAIWGSATDDVFAVGDAGTILHHDGARWTPQPSPVSIDLHALWGLAPDDVYAVGDDLTILHYDGVAWSVERSGPDGSFTGSLRAVVATAPGAVTVAGTTGIYGWNGSLLSQQLNVPTRALWTGDGVMWSAAADGLRERKLFGWLLAQNTPSASGLSGTSPSNIFAVGTVSYRYDGTSWAIGPFFDPLLATVFATTDLGTFAGGQAGHLRHAAGADVEALIARTTSDIRAVFAIDHVVFVGGRDGALDALVFHR